MDLKQECIDFAELRKRESEIAQDKADEEFSRKAIERLHEILSFGTHCYYDSPEKHTGEITIHKIAPGQMIYEVEGIQFRVKRAENHLSVTVLKHCEICSKYWESYSVGCKADVGQAIQAEHPRYECQNDEPKTTTAAERLEELIREIVA